MHSIRGHPCHNIPLDDKSLWYDNSAVGINKLNTFMKTMSQIGGLSKYGVIPVITKKCRKKQSVLLAAHTKPLFKKYNLLKINDLQ